MGYNILICEDNKYALKINASYIKKALSDMKINGCIHTYTNPEVFFSDASHLEFDIAFLDIRFTNSKYSGVDIAKKLNETNDNIVIAFITGETIDVTEAYEVRAFDYIKKPIICSDFQYTFARIIKQAASIKHYNRPNYIYLRTNYLKQKIRTSEIIYTEKIGHSIEINLKNGKKIIANHSTKELCAMLDNTFSRPNQTNIVNLNYINYIDKKNLVLKNSLKLKISRHFNKSFIEDYSKFNI